MLFAVQAENYTFNTNLLPVKSKEYLQNLTVEEK